MHAEIEVIRVDLKYCERCGGLWLRPQGSDGVYCASCAVVMAEFALSFKSKRRARLPVCPKVDLEARQRAMAFCHKGGAA